MRATLLISALIFLGFQACLKTEAPMYVPETMPPALALSHDISITFKHVPPPTEAQLREWAHYVAQHGGCIAFALIGDPDSTGALIRATFKALPRYPESPTYSDIIAFNKAMDAAKQANKQAEAIFVQDVMALLKRYPPQQNTDINGRWRDIRTFFQEPGMEAYQPYYFCATDGLQDVKMPGLLVDTVLQPAILPPNIKVFTCGWKNPVYPAGWIPLESPQALTHSLESFINK